MEHEHHETFIVMSSYVIRDTGLGWFTNETCRMTRRRPDCQYEFAALLRVLQRHRNERQHDVDPSTPAGSQHEPDRFRRPQRRVIIATAAENGATALAQLPKGTAVRAGTEILAGSACSLRAAAVKSPASRPPADDFTAVGELIFYRAVANTVNQGARPSVGSPAFLGGVFSASFTTRAGSTYQVEYKTNLLEAWTPLTNIVGDGSLKSFADESTTDPARFYRVTKQ